ncbi:MAG: hypothetical protein JW774_07380 [Candidatus Aureabacteria bacterium]|nr:hypothetical protein [Candidatus Auribacterota bacterium]
MIWIISVQQYISVLLLTDEQLVKNASMWYSQDLKQAVLVIVISVLVVPSGYVQASRQNLVSGNKTVFHMLAPESNFPVKKRQSQKASQEVIKSQKPMSTGKILALTFVLSAVVLLSQGDRSRPDFTIPMGRNIISIQNKSGIEDPDEIISEENDLDERLSERGEAFRDRDLSLEEAGEDTPSRDPEHDDMTQRGADRKRRKTAWMRSLLCLTVPGMRMSPLLMRMRTGMNRFPILEEVMKRL